jgi:hypothetical protein
MWLVKNTDKGLEMELRSSSWWEFLPVTSLLHDEWIAKSTRAGGMLFSL